MCAAPPSGRDARAPRQRGRCGQYAVRRHHKATSAPPDRQLGRRRHGFMALWYDVRSVIPKRRPFAVRRLRPALVCALFLAGMLVPVFGRERAAVNSLELRAPAGGRPTQINAGGETVLPNGRLITPRGIQVTVAPHPYGLALSPDGETLVTVNSGTAPFSVSIITGLGSRLRVTGSGRIASDEPKVEQIPPPGTKPADADPQSVYMGAAIAPDNRTLYVAEGNNGRVGIFDLVTRQRLGTVSLDGDFQGKKYAHSLTGDTKLSPDGLRLYVLDAAHFRLVVLDTVSKQIVSRVLVGRLPVALALSPDGRRR